MRWLSLVAFSLLVAPASAGENEAERLYRAMEKKIRAAKTLQVVFAAELADDGPPQKIKGSLHHAKGNKGRLEVDSEFDLKLLLVSDGKALYSQTFDDDSGHIDINPPHLDDADKTTPALLARLGVSSCLLISDKMMPAYHPSQKPAAYDADKALFLKGFKLGVSEKVDGREIQVVIYLIESKYSKVPLQASVWIDTQTHLPTKRVLIVDEGQRAWRVSETYSEFTIDGKIDPKLFQVAAFADRQKQAEELFRGMEKRIRSAKSFHLVFDGKFAGDGMQAGMNGSVHHAAGNKGRMDIETDLTGKAEKWLFVSDGKSLYSLMDGKVGIQNQPVGLDEVDKSTPGLVARLGVLSGMFFVSTLPNANSSKVKKDPFDLEKIAPARNFSLGIIEKVGERQGQVVHYRIGLPGGKKSLKASVWLDPQTQLPLKRVVVGQAGGKETFRIIETYSEFTIDGKYDAKLFEIPK
jgi:outer membrane lipoprotein-sorting protein